jgi:adenylyltransferase/sulfurtransferase
MFSIASDFIDKDSLTKLFTNEQAGAFVSFEGRVRNFNDNKKVSLLEYEILKAVAIEEGTRILAEAKTKFALINAVCTHREGQLSLGDLAVWVGVSAVHRAEAFAACRYIIDEVKHRLPIWKKEFYADGTSSWVNCQNHEMAHSTNSGGPSIEFKLNTAHSHKSPNKNISTNAEFKSFEPIEIELEEQSLYSKQICLEEIGTEGQNKLKNSRVLVVGAGGLGSPALTYLAAAGIGTIGICESDVLEISNLNRQILYQFGDLGKNKVDLAAERLRQINPFIEIITHKDRLSDINVQSLVKQYDLVLDCSDNFTTKFLLNDIAYFTQVPVIQASIYQYSGQLMLSLPNKKGQCLRCFWAKIPNANCFASCVDAGIIGAVAGILGNMQALEAIKHILELPSAIKEHVLYFDLSDYSVRKVHCYKNTNCPLCSKKHSDFNSYWQSQSAIDQENNILEKWEINILDLAVSEIKKFQLIDIREPHEIKNTFLKQLLGVSCQEIPLSKFDLDKFALNPLDKYLVICQKGIRSKKLVQDLRNKGLTNVYSVEGGMDAVARKFIA